jgi:hypothetical protein
MGWRGKWADYSRSAGARPTLRHRLAALVTGTQRGTLWSPPGTGVMNHGEHRESPCRTMNRAGRQLAGCETQLYRQVSAIGRTR